jgi:polar amino acid transport system substrate-binding protein
MRFLLLLSFFPFIYGQCPGISRIYTKIVSPFVMFEPELPVTYENGTVDQSKTTFHGISADLVRLLQQFNNTLFSDDLEIIVDPIDPNSVQKMLDALVADPEPASALALAAISVTADRETQFDFSHSVFESGIGVAVRVHEVGSESGLLAVLVSPQVWTSLGALLMLAYISAFVMYCAEHRVNDTFYPPNTAKSNSVLRNFLESFTVGTYYAIVTVSTVGYGDVVPRTRCGRNASIVLILSGLAIFSIFTGSVVSEMTAARAAEQSINSVDELSTTRTCVVEGTTSQQAGRDLGVLAVAESSLDACVSRFNSDDVQCILYDRPVLRFLASEGVLKNVNILGSKLFPQNYAMAFMDTTCVEAVNRAILAVSIEYIKSWEAYIGDNNVVIDPASSGSGWDAGAILVVAISLSLCCCTSIASCYLRYKETKEMHFMDQVQDFGGELQGGFAELCCFGGQSAPDEEVETGVVAADEPTSGKSRTGSRRSDDENRAIRAELTLIRKQLGELTEGKKRRKHRSKD